MSKLVYETKEALTYLLIAQPFFASILYDQLTLVSVDSDHPFVQCGDDATYAATDGRNIYINEAMMADELNSHERAFVIAHEVSHCMFKHLARGRSYQDMGFIEGRPFFSPLWNIAMDYVINAMLKDAGVGKMPEKGCIDQRFTGGMLSEEVYCTLYDELPPEVQKKLQQQGQGSGGGGGQDNGQDSAGDQQEGGQPGKSGGSGDLIDSHKSFDNHQLEPSNKSDGEWKRAVASAANAAKAQGKLPGNMKSIIEDYLEPQVDWKEELHTELSKRVGYDENTWRRPRRRSLVMQGVYLPGKTGKGAGHVVMAIDTSGSVSDAELAQFAGEINRIFVDCTPEKVTVLFVDADIQSVLEVDNPTDGGMPDEIAAAFKDCPGRGGTSFHPPAVWMNEHGVVPEAVIYFTDMCAPFPDERDWPVAPVWCSTSKGMEAPYGKTIEVDVQAK